jgi:hypothetical protein
MRQPGITNSRRRLRIGAVVAAAILAALATPATHPAAAAPQPAPDCAPIACAAAYIGVSEPTLSVQIVNEARRTGLPGMNEALQQLATAQSEKLAAVGTSSDAATHALIRWSIRSTHDAVRDLLLTYAISGLIARPQS